jgi:hypothetical protein
VIAWPATVTVGGPFYSISMAGPNPINELRAWRAFAYVIEDRIENRERPRIVRECFESFVARTSDTLWVGVLAPRDLFHVPENLFKRQFVWSVRGHRPSMFAPWRAPGQEYF